MGVSVIDYPCFVEIQYWNPNTSSWWVGAAGYNLMNPAAYAKKLGANGHITRITDKETGEVVYSEGADLL